MTIFEAFKRAKCSFAYRRYRGWSYRWAFGDFLRRLVFELKHNYRSKP